MGQREVQIQADSARAEPVHWKSCLIPLMAWVRTRLFPLRDAKVTHTGSYTEAQQAYDNFQDTVTAFMLVRV